MQITALTVEFISFYAQWWLYINFSNHSNVHNWTTHSTVKVICILLYHVSNLMRNETIVFLFLVYNMYQFISEIPKLDLVINTSVMAKRLWRTSQWHGMFCHDQKVKGSNPGRVFFGERITSVQVVLKSILIYQGVHCCTKVCNLHLDDSLSKSRDNRMHWTRCNLLKWKGSSKNYELFTDQLQPIYFTCNDL